MYYSTYDYYPLYTSHINDVKTVLDARGKVVCHLCHNNVHSMLEIYIDIQGIYRHTCERKKGITRKRGE